jgi:hypothetical protein
MRRKPGGSCGLCWLVVEPPLWKMMEFVSWGYYSQLNGKIKAMFQTTNQYDMFISRLPVDFFWEMGMLRVGFQWYVLNFCSCESFYQKETLGMLTTCVSQPYKYVTLEYFNPHSHGNVVEIGQQGDLHPQIHSGMVRQFNQSHMEFGGMAI